MAVLERRIYHKIKSEKEFRDYEAKWAAIEARVGGFSDKKYYFLMSGRDAIGTITWERKWDSLGTLDAAYAKLFEDPEAQNLASDAHNEVIQSEHMELYYDW